MKRLAFGVVAMLTASWLLLAVLVVGTAATAGAPAGGAVCAPVAGEQGGPRLAAAAAYAAGFRDADLVVAVAVAGAESSYRPAVRNSIGASGLWQILESAHAPLFARYDWRDPAENALMARAVWQAAGGSWNPWTTSTSGSYRVHLGEARAAVAALPAQGGSSAECGAAGDLPPAPAAFTGPDGYVDDPTSAGRITRRTLHAYTEVQRAFGDWPWGIGCWDEHAWNPRSDHPRGRACDFTVGRIGSLPNPADRAQGWRLARWLERNAVALGVIYVIWDGRIWSAARASEGWRTYTGGGVYDVATPTGRHADHLHVSIAFPVGR